MSRARPGTGLLIALVGFGLLGGAGTRERSPLPGATPGATPGTTIDVNRATVAELMLLPEIGPGRARRIVAERSANGAFASVDALERVNGIGVGTVTALRPFARADRDEPR
ncbi:MAG: ComEA family DNA-binding protein [Planctomycetota bacterium]|jgi:competence protein ComEA